MRNTITVEEGGLTMRCRLFRRTGGFADGSWVLSGYIGHEERMSCDVTVTVKRHCGNRERLTRELTATAQDRLRQIQNED